MVSVLTLFCDVTVCWCSQKVMVLVFWVCFVMFLFGFAHKARCYVFSPCFVTLLFVVAHKIYWFCD